MRSSCSRALGSRCRTPTAVARTSWVRFRRRRSLQLVRLPLAAIALPWRHREAYKRAMWLALALSMLLLVADPSRARADEQAGASHWEPLTPESIEWRDGLPSMLPGAQIAI